MSLCLFTFIKVCVLKAEKYKSALSLLIRIPFSPFRSIKYHHETFPPYPQTDIKKQASKGFTLAELLIALAILGQISVFTIPKIISTQQSSAKKVVFKETIATLSAIMYEGRITGNITVSNFKTYMFSKINAVKICNSDSAAEGCFTQTDDTGSESDGPGFVLANGATVAGIENCCDDGGGIWATGFIMDWNGAAGPNLEGDDQIWLEASFGTASTVAGTRPGTIGGCKLSGTSQTMFKNLFN